MERGNPCFQRAGSLVKEMIINQISTKIQMATRAVREINRRKRQTRNSHVCYDSVYNEDGQRLPTSLDFSRLVKDPSTCNSTVTGSHPMLLFTLPHHPCLLCQQSPLSSACLVILRQAPPLHHICDIFSNIHQPKAWGS